MFRFPLIVSGVTPRTEADGTIAFYDAGDAKVAAIPPGSMVVDRDEGSFLVQTSPESAAGQHARLVLGVMMPGALVLLALVPCRRTPDPVPRPGLD